MTPGTRFTVSPALTEFELDDHLVLYSARSPAIFVLSPTAVFVWSLVAAGETLSDTASALAHEAGISGRRAQADVERIVGEWIERGLLQDPRHAREYDVPQESPVPGQSRARTQADSGFASVVAGDTFRILDLEFRFGGTDHELIAELGALFSHLRSSGRDRSGPATTISVRHERNEWRLFSESKLLASCASRENVVPLVYTFVHMLGYAQSRSFAAMHAAAVIDGKHCVLMPGASGDGKSTLTAALVGNGMQCCADDLAVLSTPPIRLRAFPPRITLKDGSWPLLGASLPGIDEVPVYSRADGRQVKYVLPPHSPAGAPSGTEIAVTHLVFPKFVPNGETRLTPVPRAVALSMLAGAGYDIPGRISAAWVGAMTAWMRELHCFTLNFGNLDSAVRKLADLLS